ncbi:hypothetical protein BGZ68_000685 [Mortierella alpina]|nr:hypothetical protein BGZ68_000685 [Mortierella alpina]
MAPGTLNPGAFPQAMAVQTQVPGTEEAEQQWVMDPSKGRIVVGLVSAVMVIGVAIGIVQVYRASQYVAPPKKYKAVSTAVVGGKKVKKKDAYFKKPVRDSMMSSASAPAGVGPGFTSSAPTSPRSSRMMMEQSSRSPLMHERSRDSHFSVTSSSAPTLAPISSTGGYMDWGSGGGSGHSRRTNSHNNSDIHQNDSVLIDMQDSSSFRRPWNSGVGSSNSGGGGGQQSGSRQGTSSNGRISTSSTTLTDLMQFGHDSPAHSVYQSGSSSQLSSVHPRGLAYAQQQQQQQLHQQQQHHHHHHHPPPPPQHQQPPQQQQQQNQQYQYQYQQPGGRGSDVFLL